MTPRGLLPVAVLVDTSTGWGRRLVRGIINYARKHGPWEICIEARGLDEKPRLPPGWTGKGIIARVASRATVRHIAAAGVPAVNIPGIELGGVPWPRVTTDLAAAGRLAARHLLNRGLRHFAYCGLLRTSYVRNHYRGFAETTTAAGGTCTAYHHTPRLDSDWLAQEKNLARWLKQLPKPVGVFTWAAPQGRKVVDASHRAGLSVPEEVAVLAGDNDDLLCDACSPSLSGITVPAEQIGHEAAAILDRLMHRRRLPETPIPIEPTNIVVRQSTDMLAIEDEDLAQAIRFIREHAAEPIQVSDVLRAVAISRRRLERRFEEILNRSPPAEIRRVHLERAKELLAQTDLSIPEVAAGSGIGSPEHLARLLTGAIGISPLKYRQQIRGR